MRSILFLGLIFLFTMTKTYGDEFRIRSNPEQADIYVKNTNTGAKIKIGKTPLTMPLAELISNFAKADVFILELAKDGFEPYRILITKMGSNDIDLLVNLKISKNIKRIKDTDYLISQLFETQRQIRAKDYSGALKKLDKLEEKFPHYSIVYELKASAYYLDKQFKRALNYYRKAFSVNSDNRDAYIMKVYLEKKFKLTPAKG